MQIPDDFKKIYNSKTGDELAEKYNVCRRTIVNWKRKVREESESYATSTLYDSEGNVKLKWVKKPNTTEIDNVIQSIKELITDMPKSNVPQYKPRKHPTNSSTTVYVLNDIHFGMYANKEQTQDRNWDLETAEKTVIDAFSNLVDRNEESNECVIAELGDLLDINDFTNATPKHKNILDVSSTYPFILKTAYKTIIQCIYKALEKHNKVYFINVAGNHDVTASLAVQYIIKEHFSNNKRVIVNDTPRPIKYHHFGKNIFQFAHGDSLDMRKCDTVLAFDCKDYFSNSLHRYSFFGHNHQDKVIDLALCRAESFRNIAPSNAWAAGKGFRNPFGKLTSITFHRDYGEISRNIYNILM